MIKNKIIILSMAALLLNVPIKSYSYSLNNIQLATSNSSSSEAPSQGSDTVQPPSSESGSESNSGSSSGSGESSNQPSTGGSSSDSNTQNKPLENKGGNNNVELEGGIGEWGPNKDDSLPKFEGENANPDNKLEEGQYYTISATVPLKMEFLIKNENENGSSPNGKFITPYYKVINNGSHTLNVNFESFEYATSSTSKISDEIQEQLGKLYVVGNPTPNNGNVEMKLSLVYDRPSNSYFKKINLVPTNSPTENAPTITSKLSSSSNTTQLLGTLDANEEGRLYYASDLWESPKSENIQTGVTADFNLKISFSIDRKVTESNPAEGTTGNEQQEQTN